MEPVSLLVLWGLSFLIGSEIGEEINEKNVQYPPAIEEKVDIKNCSLCHDTSK